MIMFQPVVRKFLAEFPSMSEDFEINWNSSWLDMTNIIIKPSLNHPQSVKIMFKKWCKLKLNWNISNLKLYERKHWMKHQEKLETEDIIQIYFKNKNSRQKFKFYHFSVINMKAKFINFSYILTEVKSFFQVILRLEFIYLIWLFETLLIRWWNKTSRAFKSRQLQYSNFISILM